MALLTSTDTRTHSMHGVTFSSYARTESGSRQLAGWSVRFESQTPGQPHCMSHEEVLYVLSGRLDVRIDHDDFEAGSGDVVLVPAGASFCVSNNTDDPARAWVVTTIGMTATMTADGTQITPPWAQ